MAEHRLAPRDLAYTRFATSPLWETVASLRVLQAPPGGVHSGWADAIRERVRRSRLDLTRLLALVPPGGPWPTSSPPPLQFATDVWRTR